MHTSEVTGKRFFAVLADDVSAWSTAPVLNLVEQLRELSELHANGSLSNAEFEQAKTRLLNDEDFSPPRVEMADSSHTLLALQNELTALDRQWTIEREKYKVVGRYNSSIPKPGDGTKSGFGVVIFGGIWTAVASFIAINATSIGAPPIFWIMPAIGVVVIIAGLFSSGEMSEKADAYQTAEADYQSKRAAIEARIRALAFR